MILSQLLHREDTVLPKQTFFNLAEEKRHTLIQAAKKEFSRVSLYEASIANIVKEADIPRGSFYQYFKDKDDLYFYLLTKLGEQQWKRLYTNLEKYDGDLFKSIFKLYKEILDITDNADERNFYRNVFLNMNYRTEKIFNHNVDIDLFRENFSLMKQLVNTRELNLVNDEDLFHMIQMTTTLMFQNIILKFAHSLTNEEAFKNFTNQLDLMQRGFLKAREEVE